MSDLTIQQRLDLKRLLDDATLVEALAAVCEREAQQWIDRTLGAVLDGVHKGERNHEHEAYCVAQVDAWRTLVAKLREIGKRPIQS